MRGERRCTVTQKILLIESLAGSSGDLAEQLYRGGYTVAGISWEAYRGLLVSYAILDFMDFDLVIFASRRDNSLLLDQCRRIKFLLGLPSVCVLDVYDEVCFINVLNSGFDDCCAELHLQALLSRIRSLLWREMILRRKTFCCHGICINFSERSVYRNRLRIGTLTAREFDLLIFLIQRRGRALSIEMLSYFLFRDTSDSYRRRTEAMVRDVRLKIEPDPSEHFYIRNVRRFGYLFVDDTQRAPALGAKSTGS